MLDQQFSEEDAVTTAMRSGARNAELIEWAVEYANNTAG
jgi:hypothetical protein